MTGICSFELNNPSYFQLLLLISLYHSLPQLEFSFITGGIKWTVQYLGKNAARKSPYHKAPTLWTGETDSKSKTESKTVTILKTEDQRAKILKNFQWCVTLSKEVILHRSKSQKVHAWHSSSTSCICALEKYPTLDLLSWCRREKAIHCTKKRILRARKNCSLKVLFRCHCMKKEPKEH